MIGHHQIIDARANGYTPTQVWVHLLDHEPTEFDKRDAEDALQNGFLPQILVAPSERINRLPLLVIHDLIVHIVSTDDERTIEFFNHASKFKPKKLIGCAFNEVVIEEMA